MNKEKEQQAMPAAKKVKIKLNKGATHTHDGKEYGEGDEFEVTERQAKWLVEELKKASRVLPTGT